MKTSFNLDLNSTKSNIIPCHMFNYITYSSYIFFILISLLVIYSFNQIENSVCDCPILAKKTYIKEWFIFMMVYQTAQLFLFLISGEKCYNQFNEKYILSSFLLIILIIIITHIIMCFRAFIYLNELRVSCKCAYNLSQKILFWYFLIVIGIFSSIIFLFIISIIYLFIFIFQFNFK